MCIRDSNGITVKDDAGNEVRKDISLNPNASTNISYKTTVAESHNYYLSLIHI